MGWKFGERLGNPECPYLRRWVADFWLFSIRLHHWIASDDQRYFHDHSWSFASLILKGGYTEWTPTPIDEVVGMGPRVGRRYGRWSLLKRPAEWKHTVEVESGGAWTLMLTGREKRVWGFWVGGKFRKRNKYFYEHGHHPCEK